MRRYRLSIVMMMGIVVACAMSFAALRSGSDLWYSAYYTLTMFILLIALLAARFRRGGERAFWFGFAVFGWGYYFLGLGPLLTPISTLIGSDGESINRNLITTRLLLFVVSLIRPPTDDLDMIDKITANTRGIAFLLLTLVVAIGGGLLSLVVRGRKHYPRPKADHSIPKPSAPVAIVAVAFLAIPGMTALSEPSPRVSYFPVANVESNIALRPFTASRFSRYLQAMGEPSLSSLAERDPGATVYRFLLLPSFQHPICVRIEKEGAGARLHAVVLDRDGGYSPGGPVIRKEVILDAAQWSEFLRRLEELDYWGDPIDNPRQSGCDGDRYVIEGVSEGRYRVLHRREPEGPYLAACEFMLRLAVIRRESNN